MKSLSSEAIINVNDFYNICMNDIGKLVSGVSKGSAIIFNDTGKPVDFYVYNSMDSMCWLPTQKINITHGNYGTITASGKYFKIHPDKNKINEFLVVPNEAYIYKGPGVLVHIEKV
ncbi:hypothetical protein [Pseudotamlana agarivorans]|uniref:hypothetical protein n=1 Tax=Pseudotamlana agarivorans TaxID=481183 RepID=UPI000836B135|nr:hypothetical protein [Tamlana agarivorans]